LSTLASEILQKCYFLCSVLAERKEYYLQAFKIGLYGLEMPRLPASTKPLEVSFLLVIELKFAIFTDQSYCMLYSILFEVSFKNFIFVHAY